VLVSYVQGTLKVMLWPSANLPVLDGSRDSGHWRWMAETQIYVHSNFANLLGGKAGVLIDPFSMDENLVSVPAAWGLMRHAINRTHTHKGHSGSYVRCLIMVESCTCKTEGTQCATS
jgi:hypothetical protein